MNNFFLPLCLEFKHDLINLLNFLKVEDSKVLDDDEEPDDDSDYGGSAKKKKRG
jgi:hypothetical protein